MATYIYGSSWTGKYSGNTRTLRVYAAYTIDNSYSATQAKVTLNTIGIEQTSSGATEFTSASESYVTATFNGTTKKFSKGDASYTWSGAQKKSYGGGTSVYWLVNKKTTSQSLTLKIYGCKSPDTSSAAWHGSSTKSVTLTISALAPITITFNGNGKGTAPASISTYAGVANALPTMANVTGFNFYRWNTKSDGTGTEYEAGASAKFNANTILYAVWRSNYVAPTLTQVLAYRVSSSASGINPTVLSSGTRGFFKCQYTSGQHYTLNSAQVLFKNSAGTTIQTITLTNSSGTYYGYSTTAVTLDTTKGYIVQGKFVVTGDDGVQRTITDATTFISAELNAIDVSKVSNGTDTAYSVAFGGNASDTYEANGRFDCYMNAYFSNDVYSGGAKLATIPTLITKSDDTASTISAGTWVSKKERTSVTLEPGIYIIKASIGYRSKSTATGTTDASAGHRLIRIGADDSSSLTGSVFKTYVGAGQEAYVQGMSIRNFTSTTTVYVQAYSSTQVGFYSARIEVLKLG